jgi:hypothetical protein
MKLTTFFRLVFRYRTSTALFPLLSCMFTCRDKFWFYLYTTLRHPYQARPRMIPFPWKIDEGWNCPVKVLRKKLQRGITIAAPEFSLIKRIVFRFVLMHTSVCHSKGLRCFTYSRSIGLYIFPFQRVYDFFECFILSSPRIISTKTTNLLVTNSWCSFNENPSNIYF